MREKYNHFRINGEIVLADPRSSKSIYGHYFPEYMNSDDPDFLREGEAYLGPRLGWAIFFQLTQPAPGIDGMLGDYGKPGEGFMAGEIKVPWEDGYRQGCMHQSRIRFKD